MLPAIVFNFRQLPAALRSQDTRLHADHWMSGMLELAAFGGFLAMCIGLMAEFS
jgi:hypothetical protein